MESSSNAVSFGNSKLLTMCIEKTLPQNSNEGEVNITSTGPTGFMHVLGWELCKLGYM